MTAQTTAQTTSHFTPEEREALAVEHFPWAEAVLAKKFGPQSAEYAGLALVEALDSFDPARGPEFRPWLYQNLIWVSRREHRAFAGRVGSRQHNAGLKTFSLLDDDRIAQNGSDDLLSEATPDKGAIERESIIDALREIEQLPVPQRWIVLGRFAGIGDRDISRIIGREKKHINRTIDRLWRSV